MITKTSESRYEQILQYEKLDALNDEEKEVAKIIIKNLIDLFHLSGDKLIHKIIDHNIEIINLMPISVKQYRFPLIHKEKISKQISLKTM